ncbi:hypothetical protein [Parendozoicomonas haliclonae]|uniref:Uncharacterized protein n=1 Tax=Parendozoicomonas haliclonae TaxID=1960125 RepID=A0A1X7AIW8_9GAMM|nr:hypothetical protein [Parendozoicomonas haliclonae]SMA45144.1 hypothetical protein EHSB41UT_01857 [Parendozoicomonas haliclonae]
MSEPSKIENCLFAFLDAGREGLRQLEVSSPYTGYTFTHDPGQFWSSCLNTDVSRVGKMGITIARESDPFIRQTGDKAHFKRYWLQDRTAARLTLARLNLYRIGRHAEPLSDDLARQLVEQFPEAVTQDKTG